MLQNTKTLTNFMTILDRLMKTVSKRSLNLDKQNSIQSSKYAKEKLNLSKKIRNFAAGKQDSSKKAFRSRNQWNSKTKS